MSPNSSALGKYATIAAFIVILAVIGTWLFLIVTNGHSEKLEFWAGICFGAVLGVGGALTRLNGTVAKTDDHSDRITALEAKVNKE